MQLEVYGQSKQGSSKSNGDMFYISDDKKIILLADGASGAGDEGKCLMGQTCLDVLLNHPYLGKETPEVYLDNLFCKINNKLIELSQERKKKVYGTLVIAMIEKNHMIVASLGDSPTYLLEDDQVIQVARSPRKHEWMIKENMITNEEYEAYIEGLHPWMRSSFNLFLPMVVPHHKIERRNFHKDSIAIVCCDGVSDWCDKEEMILHIKNHPLETAVDQIITWSEERSMASSGYSDDMTIVAIKVN